MTLAGTERVGLNRGFIIPKCSQNRKGFLYDPLSAQTGDVFFAWKPASTDKGDAEFLYFDEGEARLRSPSRATGA